MPRSSIAQVYADINTSMPREYWDYSSHAITWGSLIDYEPELHLGGGEFSSVFEAVKEDDADHNKVVVKVFLTDTKALIAREVKILETLRGGTNIIRLLDTVQDDFSGYKALVLERVASTDFRELCQELTDLHVRHYTRQLLLALDYCHSKGVMHRDVKPDNVMIDHEAGTLRLIDMGQAEFYFPGKEYDVKVGTLHYRAPELLMNHGQHHYSLDMWSAGCMLASMISGRVPFFTGRGNASQLVKVTRVLGSQHLKRYVADYGLDVDLVHGGLLGHPRKAWHSIIHLDNSRVVNAQALDLLDKLLVFDHGERLTACQALNHPYLSTSTHPAPTSTSSPSTSTSSPSTPPSSPSTHTSSPSTPPSSPSTHTSSPSTPPSSPS